MAYYVGTQEFASLYDAIPYAQLVNGTVTSEPVSTSGMLTDPVLDTSFETPPEDIPGPSIPGDGGEIDNGLEINGRITPDLEMLIAIMVGTQGTIEGLDPETIEALQTAIEGSSAEELERIAQEIEEAGGFEEWLAQQPTGDPGDLEPPPAPEPEPEEEPEVVQVPISEADFNEQFPNVDPSEYTESGTWTDPETGIVYVINIPPPAEEEPTEEEPGGGGAEAPTEEEGEPTEDQPEEEEVIVDPTDSTVDDEDAETAETIPTDTTETETVETTPEEEEPDIGVAQGIPDFYTVREDGTVVTILDPDTPLEPWEIPPWVDTETPGTYPESGPKPDEEITEEEPELDLPTEPDVVFDPTRTPDFPGGPAPIPEQEPVPPVEEVPETPEEPTPPAEEPEQPTEETEPTPTTEQPTEQPTPTEEAPETPEQPGTETPSDTPTTGTDETGTAGEGEGDGTGTGTGTGEGEGEGDGTGTGEKRDGLFDDYQEFMTTIGYQPVQLQQLIAPPKKDYFRELDNLIGRSLFGKMI